MLNNNDIWKLKDMIKCGIINYNIGDKVIIFRRKSNNCKHIKDNSDYIIRDIEGDSLIINLANTKKLHTTIKVHKTYMITREYLRDFKLCKII